MGFVLLFRWRKLGAYTTDFSLLLLPLHHRSSFHAAMVQTCLQAHLLQPWHSSASPMDYPWPRLDCQTEIRERIISNVGLWPSQMLTWSNGKEPQNFEIYGNLGAHPRFQKEILGWPQGSPKIMGILMKQVRYIISLYRLYNHTCHIIHSWKRKSNKKHQHLWLTFRLTSISPSTPEHHLFLLPKSLGPSALSSHPALTHFTTAGYWNMTNSTCPQHGNKKPNRKLPTKLYKTW